METSITDTFSTSKINGTITAGPYIMGFFPKNKKWLVIKTNDNYAEYVKDFEDHNTAVLYFIDVSLKDPEVIKDKFLVSFLKGIQWAANNFNKN